MPDDFAPGRAEPGKLTQRQVARVAEMSAQQAAPQIGRGLQQKCRGMANEGLLRGHSIAG
jgi:hypothetical protein